MTLSEQFRRLEFLHGDRKHLHALSFPQLLQQRLAAVLEAYRVAISVHLGGGLDERYFLRFADTPVRVASFWECRAESAGRRAGCKRRELVSPLPTSGCALETSPSLATTRCRRADLLAEITGGQIRRRRQSERSRTEPVNHKIFSIGSQPIWIRMQRIVTHRCYSCV